jgi:hypothetical protein
MMSFYTWDNVITKLFTSPLFFWDIHVSLNNTFAGVVTRLLWRRYDKLKMLLLPCDYGSYVSVTAPERVLVKMDLAG